MMTVNQQMFQEMKGPTPAIEKCVSGGVVSYVNLLFHSWSTLHSFFDIPIIRI